MDPIEGTVLIYRIGSLGDTVVSLPCFHAIAERFPDLNRVVLTNLPGSANAPFLMDVIGPSGLVHDCIAYRAGMGLSGYLALAAQIRSLNVSRVIYLAPERSLSSLIRDVCFFRLAGVSAFSGLPWRREERQVLTLADGSVEREASRLARNIASAVGTIDLNDLRFWDLRLSATEREAALELTGLSLEPTLAINLGGKDRRKDWGSARWSELVARLSALGWVDTLLFVGAEDDRAQSDIVAASWSGRVVNLSGRCSPRVAAAALAQSSLFVGHDSGPLHLAAASGVPSVGIFGNLNRARQWHPYGDHVHIVQDDDGIDAIDVARVLAAVEQLRGQVRESNQ